MSTKLFVTRTFFWVLGDTSSRNIRRGTEQVVRYQNIGCVEFELEDDRKEIFPEPSFDGGRVGKTDCVFARWMRGMQG